MIGQNAVRIAMVGTQEGQGLLNHQRKQEDCSVKVQKMRLKHATSDPVVSQIQKFTIIRASYFMAKKSNTWRI